MAGPFKTAGGAFVSGAGETGLMGGPFKTAGGAFVAGAGETGLMSGPPFRCNTILQRVAKNLRVML